jgi:hypothetical protein
MIVPMAETKSEPRQPKRFEKKANIHAISRWKPERGLPMPLFHCDAGQFPMQIYDLTPHCFSIKSITRKTQSVIVFRNFGKK